MSSEKVKSDSLNSDLFKLLRAIKDCDTDQVKEIVNTTSQDIINSPFGPLHVHPLELACSLPITYSLPIAKLLLSCGAEVNNRDKLGRTALHYVCSLGNTELAKIIIEKGAKIDCKYEVNSLPRKIPIFKDFGISQSLPLPDCWGRTPLHQAVKFNFKDIVKLLLENGANVEMEDEHGITPLLIAGANIKNNDSLLDYEEIVNLLIIFKADINITNKCTGTTPLHHSVSLNSLRATKLLLESGAIIKVDFYGQTAIHEASSKSYFNILSLLLLHEDTSVNRPDKDGRTALHKAAFSGSRECVKLLINFGGNLSATTKSGITVMDVIFSHVPRPVHLLKEILDSKITANDASINDINFKVALDFKILVPTLVDHQMSVVSAILNSGSEKQSLEVLQHPLIHTFLHLKWEKLRIFFILLVLLQFIFVISLSTYVILIVHRPEWSEFLIAFSRNILLLSAFSLFTHAVIQCLLVPRHYFKQYEMWLNLLSAFVSFIVAIVPNENIEKTASGEIKLIPSDWVLHVTSIVILLAWIELMLLIGRFPSFGYYALMFSAVLQNVIKVLSTFVCLVIGFALSFSIQFHTFDQFSDPWRAIIKTTVMMMGEFEYADLFADQNNDTNTIRLPATSRVIFLLFIILASIVLMNLMVGLAVSDIQGLQKEGYAKRIAKQATFLSHLEKVLSHKFLRSDWFSSELYKFLTKRRNLEVNLVLKPGRRDMKKDIGDVIVKCLPLYVLEAIINIALNNNTHNCTNEETNDPKLLCEIITSLRKLEEDLKDVKNSLLQRDSNTKF